MAPDTTIDLLEKVEELEQRLAEAEETLRALRSGEVDAVVASGPQGDQVYTLTGADQAYRMMVQNMAEGAITVTREGLILFSNEQFARMLEIPLERVTGSSLHDLVVTKDATVLAALLENPAGSKGEIRLKMGPKAHVPVQLSGNPLQLDGIEGVCFIVTDLTEQKKNQRRAIAQQKLESLGTLASGIAHDFNNLLGGILSQTELASSEIQEGASPQAELDNIRVVAARGAEIVRQLMVYAGQETDKLELVDVSSLVEGTAALLKVVIAKRLALKFELAADVPQILANPAGLRQVLINLVTNASEAMRGKEGEVKVVTSRVTVDQRDYLQLEVSDAGCGMTPETLARIFDPFFTTKAAERGLGLAVVQGIVVRLGGSISAQSQVNQGTTFQVVLPGAVKPPEAHRDRSGIAEENIRATNGTVLMVEDEASLRVAVARMLRKKGLTVLEAIGGTEAIEILQGRAKDITVVFLDATLPGTPSPEVYREVKRLRPDLPVVLTSAYSEEKVAAAFTGLTTQLFIRKPYRLEDLLKLLS